jgi:hypothetical protein
MLSIRMILCQTQLQNIFSSAYEKVKVQVVNRSHNAKIIFGSYFEGTTRQAEKEGYFD